MKALDARLLEHNGQVERQITDLQARITIELKTLHLQDRSIADGLQNRIEELHKEFAGQLAALRQTADAGGRAVHDQAAALRREMAGIMADSLQNRVDDLQKQFASHLEGMQNAVEAETPLSPGSNSACCAKKWAGWFPGALNSGST